MIIAFGSDLHLEFGATGLIESLNKVDADVLILAGDIAPARDFQKMHEVDTLERRKNLKKFFDAASARFPRVILVMGNHEHYGSEVSRTETKIKESLSCYDNVTLLENEHLVLDGVVFFGSTMWTDMAEYNLYEESKIATSMNDFKQIKLNENGNYIRFMPKNARTIHYRSIKALSKTLDKYPDSKFVAVHHHAPSFKSIAPMFHNSPINGAYYSLKLETMICSGEFSRLPNLLIHGHIHHRALYTLDTMQVISNPRGYERYEASADYFEFQLEAI